MNRAVALALLFVVSAGCTAKMPVAAVPAGPAPGERLARADGLVLQGCLECLLDAYREYQSLQQVPAAADAATDGLVRAAALIAVRERELGMVDEGYLDRARSAASTNPARQAAFGPLLDLLDAVPVRGGGRDTASGQRLLAVSRARAEWAERLRPHADEDPAWAVAWLWLNCTFAQARTDRDFASLLAPLVKLHDAEIVTYQSASCATGGDEKLQALADADDRWRELDLWAGSRRIARADLDGAQVFLTRAYEWHRQWPTVANALGNLYLTAEEFQSALELYDASIALIPGMAESMLGRVRALSYLGRAEEAIAAASELLPIGNPGDAYYWRAWNENQLDRLEPAWTDVEAAGRLWINSEVLRLAGIVAYRRHELETAKARFESALEIPGNADCEVMFDLAGVDVELATWDAGANGYASAAACLERSRASLAAEIETLRADTANPERAARQIARREQQRAAALRMQIQSWFNGAVANLQLGRRDEARQLAEKVQDDQQFGARAREILARVR